jgi:Uncharacterized protein conserved in bacteria
VENCGELCTFTLLNKSLSQMDRFIGNIDAKADAKGRVFIPAIFRKILNEIGEDCFILRKDIYQACLILYPFQSWNEELDKLRLKLNKWNPDHQALYRQFLLDSEKLEMEPNGRILIPKRYLQMTGITSDVRFIGMDNTIEIWNRSNLEESLLLPEEFERGIRQFLGGLADE